VYVCVYVYVYVYVYVCVCVCVCVCEERNTNTQTHTHRGSVHLHCPPALSPFTAVAHLRRCLCVSVGRLHAAAEAEVRGSRTLLASHTKAKEREGQEEIREGK